MTWMARFLLGAASLLAAGASRGADDPCAAFKWDLAAERAVYASAPTPASSGLTSAEAPDVRAGVLYELTLHPQETVKLQAAVSKRMLDDGAFAGLVRIRVPHTGRYRISIDGGFWIDVASGPTTLPSRDFSGAQNCRTPRKVVLYELAKDADVVIQLTGASASTARLVVVADSSGPG